MDRGCDYLGERATMSLTVPNTFQRPSVAAGARLELDAVVRAKHMQAVVESGHFLRARLRPLLSFGSESQSTTSTSYADVMTDIPCEASAHGSGSVSIDVRGDNTNVQVVITDSGATTATATLSIGAGPANASAVLSVSGLTGTDWRIDIKQKVPTTGTATIYGAHIRETRHTSGTIA